MFLSYIRTILVYLVLILAIRLMGKRQIGQMEPSEFVVTMLIANLASIPMQDSAIPLYCGVLPILTVLGLELVLSALCLRSIGLRRLFCGKPVILIDNGRIVRENLKKTRVTMDELTEALRQKDVLELKIVQYAILETSGQISVFPYPEHRPASAAEAGIQTERQFLPVTIISDGHLMSKNLTLAGVDENWVERILRDKGSTRRDTLLLTVDGGGNISWYPREEGL